MIPIVLVPGLLCSAEIFAPQVAALWPYGPVTIAATLEGETIPKIAARSWLHRRHALRSQGSPWAASSALRSCGRRPGA